MRFKVGGVSVLLQGDPSLSNSLISLKAIWKAIQEQGEGLLVELGCIGVTEEGNGNKVPPIIQKVLEHYTQVFELPMGLPPRRFHDHTIVLQPGTAPVIVRPYRYPQVQKEEIEKLVQDMLAVGIIQPSFSPFSSLVLLVKKKEGGWRFCVDYRVLNKASVSDNFPL